MQLRNLSGASRGQGLTLRGRQLSACPSVWWASLLPRLRLLTSIRFDAGWTTLVRTCTSAAPFVLPGLTRLITLRGRL